MKQLKEIFMLSLFILLLPFIVFGEEYNSTKTDTNSLFLINAPQDGFYNSHFIFFNKNKFFSTFSNDSNKKNDKGFHIENLNINRKKELNTITKESYIFEDFNLNNNYLNYSHKVKVTNSSDQLYSVKDKKNLFKTKKEGSIGRGTYELIKLISSIAVNKLN